MVPSHLLWLTLGMLFLNAEEGGGAPRAPPFLEGSSTECGEREHTFSGREKETHMFPPGYLVPLLKDLQEQRQILLSDHLLLTPAGGCHGKQLAHARCRSWMPLASLPTPLPSPHISPMTAV